MPESILSRRQLLLAGLAAGSTAFLPRGLSAAPAPAADTWRGLKMGVATYTFSRLPLDETVAGIKRVGVKYASIKDAHLALKSTAEQRKAVVAKFQAAGITPISCGVVGMNDNAADLKNAFEYAKDCGLPVIVCKPTPESLPALDGLVKTYDIKLAIHNHGPEDKVWPSPLGVFEAIQKLDERIGVCIDVGHTARCGVDPAKAIRTCAPRLYDLHIKDIAAASGNSKPVELGRGVLDLKAILQALLDTKYAYHVGLEYEKDMKDPLAGVAESIGYLHGLLAAM